LLFGKGENARMLRNWEFFKELRRGRTIVQWLKDHDIKAVVIWGYNDVAVYGSCDVQTAGIPAYVWTAIYGTPLAFEGGGERSLSPPGDENAWRSVAAGHWDVNIFVKYGVNPQNIFYSRMNRLQTD